MMVSAFMIAMKKEIKRGSGDNAATGSKIKLKIGGFKNPKLETVPPGRMAWEERGLLARKMFIASSLLNSIKLRFVTLNSKDEAIMIKADIPLGNNAFINFLVLINYGIIIYKLI